MRESAREKKSTRRQNSYSGRKKTKQNRIKCVWEENKPQWLRRGGIVPGSQQQDKKGKKEEKKLLKKTTLVRRRRIKAEVAHQDVQSEAAWSWKVQICNSFKLADECGW